MHLWSQLLRSEPKGPSRMATPWDFATLVPKSLALAEKTSSNLLVHIINQVWIHEELPDNWRWSVILPYWKCKGINCFVAITVVLHFSQCQESYSPVFFSPGPHLASAVSTDHSKLASCKTTQLLITFLLPNS